MKSCDQFIGGRWCGGTSDETSEVTNSSTGAAIARVAHSSRADVDRAVEAATTAFAGWSATPVTQRVQYFFRYKQLLESHVGELAEILSREHGKTRQEAEGSIRRGIEVVELACSTPMLLKGETLENTGGGVDYESHRQPLGVCVGITPFNFPAMIPMWMFPLAIACGNAFILKPSPHVPLTAVRLIELLAETGLPDGVANLVHGGKETAQALLTHPGVQAVSFVGSTPVASEIYRVGTAHGKRVQAAGGAKNHVVVLPDAPRDEMVEGILSSAYGCAGERCMAISSVLATAGAGDMFIEALVEALDAMKVGPTDRESNVDMGPLISKQHLERVEQYIGAATKDGARLVRDGRGIRVDETPGGYFLGPTVVDGVSPAQAIAREEVFGPVLCVSREDSLDDALRRIEASPYGNAATIYTRDGGAAREFRRRANCGMIGINVGVPAPAAFFPFSGWNASFFGDLHLQGMEGIQFYTRQKVVMKRWF